MSIFKACDIRGRYGSELIPDFALRLGRAVGTELSGGSVVIGGDVRPSTPTLKEALSQGLVASGCHVKDVGIVPTPAFYFAIDTLEADGGVMVTASHNPSDDNGFKISLGPMPITEEDLARLQRRIERRDYRDGCGTYRPQEILSRYQSDLLSRFTREPSGGKIVVDAGNGCYSNVAPRVIKSAGHDVVELFCVPDGHFPHRAPNPAVKANLTELCQRVVSSGADLGVAYDGDGDRAVFVDERGHVVESDRSIVLFARYLLRQGPGEVVFDIKCSSAVPEGIRSAGGTPIMERSGHAFIKTTLLRRGAVLGGEISGHFFFGELGRDDGLYATLTMLKILAEARQPLSVLAESAPRYPITPDLRIPCSPEDAATAIEELIHAFRGEDTCEVATLDGVRVAWPDGWALARPSVTEPLITLRFEARSETGLIDIQERLFARSPRLRQIMAAARR